MEVGTVRQIDIEREMKDAYLDYAMSVITSRALPDARDGLKPVQRRILYAMHDMGLRSDRSYKKSARIVGEVLGKYHPHGDAAVYDAMVRMAQEFSMRYPLVDGQGNFGSIDGDSPAAMRYTEARMASIAEEMLTDIDKDTVDFVDNFDGSLQEPEVLPSTLPNLLLSGGAGIAVGMSTNIPPHNLNEVCDALIYMIDNVDNTDTVTVEDLMNIIKGPDFPTGGLIYRYREPRRKGEEPVDMIRKAYAMGRGRIKMRAKAHIEPISRNRHQIVVTELPYMVNKTTLIERIAKLVREESVEGISDLRDESDRRGMRLVIEVRSTADPHRVLDELLTGTQMEETFGVINLALVDGEPRLLSLKKALQVYLEHRQEIITRRSEHELTKAKDRAHVLEGLNTALDFLDEVIETIRRSRWARTARNNLMREFNLTEVQAQAILQMPLRRLASLEQKKIRDELEEARERIDYLEDLLANPHKILGIIKEQLHGLKEKYGDARRTRIVGEVPGTFTAKDLVPDRDVFITITTTNRIVRLMGRYRARRTGITQLYVANNLDELLIISEQGRGYRVKAHQVPRAKDKRSGVPLIEVVNWDADETVGTIVALPAGVFEEDEEWYLTMATEGGKIKRVAREDLASLGTHGTTVIGVDEGDRFRWAALTSGDDEILMVTREGQAIRFAEEEVRAMGLTAGGVMGIKLQGDDCVVSMQPTTQGESVILAMDKGYGKRVPLEDYPTQGRYGQGVQTAKLSPEVGEIVDALLTDAGEEIALVTAKGRLDRRDANKIPEMSRYAQGHRIFTFKKKGDSLARVVSLELK